MQLLISKNGRIFAASFNSSQVAVSEIFLRNDPQEQSGISHTIKRAFFQDTSNMSKARPRESKKGWMLSCQKSGMQLIDTIVVSTIYKKLHLIFSKFMYFRLLIFQTYEKKPEKIQLTIDETRNILCLFTTQLETTLIGSKYYVEDIQIYDLGENQNDFKLVTKISKADLLKRARGFLRNHRRLSSISSKYQIVSVQLLTLFESESHMMVAFESGQTVYIRFDICLSSLSSYHKSSGYFSCRSRPTKEWRVTHVSGNCILDYQLKKDIQKRSTSLPTQSLHYKREGGHGRVLSACFAGRTLFLSFGQPHHNFRGGTQSMRKPSSVQNIINFLKNPRSQQDQRRAHSSATRNSFNSQGANNLGDPVVTYGVDINLSQIIIQKENKKNSQIGIGVQDSNNGAFNAQHSYNTQQYWTMGNFSQIASFIQKDIGKIIKVLQVFDNLDSDYSEYAFNGEACHFSRPKGEKLKFDEKRWQGYLSSLENQPSRQKQYLSIISSRGIYFQLKLRPIDRLGLYLFFQEAYPPVISSHDEKKVGHQSFLNQKTHNQVSIISSLGIINELGEFYIELGPLETASCLLQTIVEQNGTINADYHTSYLEFERMLASYGCPHLNKEQLDAQVQQFIRGRRVVTVKEADKVRMAAKVLWFQIRNLFVLGSQDQILETSYMVNSQGMNSNPIGQSMDVPFKYSMYQEKTSAFKNSTITSRSFGRSIFIEASVLYLQRILRPYTGIKIFENNSRAESQIFKISQLQENYLQSDLLKSISRLKSLHLFLQDNINMKPDQNLTHHLYGEKSRDFLEHMISLWNPSARFGQISIRNFEDSPKQLREELLSYAGRAATVLGVISEIIEHKSVLEVAAPEMIKDILELKILKVLSYSFYDEILTKALLIICSYISDGDPVIQSKAYSRKFPALFGINEERFIKKFRR